MEDQVMKERKMPEAQEQLQRKNESGLIQISTGSAWIKCNYYMHLYKAH